MRQEHQERFREKMHLTPQQLVAVVKIVDKRLFGSELEFLAEFRDELGILSGLIRMPRKLPRRPVVSYDGFSGRMDAEDAARVTAYQRAMDMVSRADIDFVVLGDETLVVVSGSDRDWSRLEPVWLVILAKLERLGLIEIAFRRLDGESNGQKEEQGTTSTTSAKPDELPDASEMRKYYPEYNPTTALDVLQAAVAAYPESVRQGKKLGATFIARHTSPLSRETIQLYLSAFRKAGLKTWKGVPLS